MLLLASSASDTAYLLHKTIDRGPSPTHCLNGKDQLASLACVTFLRQLLVPLACVTYLRHLLASLAYVTFVRRLLATPADADLTQADYNAAKQDSFSPCANASFELISHSCHKTQSNASPSWHEDDPQTYSIVIWAFAKSWDVHAKIWRCYTVPYGFCALASSTFPDGRAVSTIAGPLPQRW